ncbi:MAG TPA: CDP-diacylglycerol--glycerol-3-phosphate 3-phosphatidyltransferase [Phycisphaerales bacterium]|nr:CDP-diacylglycerol--glycerol-3-phosphate 3-phosphatidyltransferase [Phycisphaerales bacterium]
MAHAPTTDRATGWRLHTPNTLVGVRIVLSVVIFVLLSGSVYPDDRTTLLVAAVLFIAAAITDALDGHLARKWHAITRFGRIMDPLADKILTLGCFVLLAGPNFANPDPVAGFTGWMVIVIISRELLVTSLRGMLEGEGVDASANWLGKLKMILQSIAIPAILLTLALADPLTPSLERAISVLAWTTTLVTAASAWLYITKAITHAKADRP